MGRARLKWQQAESMASNGRLEEAERTLSEGKNLAESIPQWEEERLLLPNILSSLALVQKRQGKHDRVLNTLKTLMKTIIERRLGKIEHGVTLVNIGTTLFFLGKLDVALSYTLKANKLLEKLANPQDLMEAAQGMEEGYGPLTTAEEKKRLIVNQVPACYNLAILYHHLGFSLESNKCLNAAKSLAISKLGFGNKVTDLVTKNVELRSKDGKPTFLILRFTEPLNKQMNPTKQHEGEILDTEKEGSLSRGRSPHMESEKGSQFEFDDYRQPMTVEEERPIKDQDYYPNQDKLPQLKTNKLRNVQLRSGGVHGGLATRARPQTDTPEWSPSFDSGYPQVRGMPKMAVGRPSSIGEVCGVRVTKLPSIYGKLYSAGDDQSRETFNRGGDIRTFDQRDTPYDILRVHSGQSNNREGSAISSRGGRPVKYDQPNGQRIADHNGRLHTPSFDQRTKLDNSSVGLTNDDRIGKPGTRTQPRNGQSKTVEHAASKRDKNQPLIHLSHFGFNQVNEGKPLSTPSQDDRSTRDEPAMLSRESKPELEDLFEKKYKPSVYSRHEGESSQKKQLDVNRLQITMRYMG